MLAKKKRVLITVPFLSLPGGVTGLFNVLRMDKIDGIKYFSVNFNDKKWSILFLPFQYLRFIFKIRQFDVVHLNPSMDAKSFYRDSIFCFISKSLFGRKIIVYWHGWQSAFFHSIRMSPFKKKLFRYTFGKAEYHLVLANQFSLDLLSIGCKGKILLESNVTEMLTSPAKREKSKGDIWRLLYISRITEGKGWDIAIRTLQLLQERGLFNVHLTIAGEGDCISKAKSIVAENEIKNVNFTGYVSGKKKRDLLEESDVLFFPTCYPEGMPISILEGVMYGMPIISRNVGGIPDHIKNNVNGFLTDSTNPEDFVEFIIQIVSNAKLYARFNRANIELSKNQFGPERLIKKLNELYN